MSAPELSDDDRVGAIRVSKALCGAFAKAGEPVLLSFRADRAVTETAMQLGIADAHVKGATAALATLDQATRDPLIRNLPNYVTSIIAQGERP